MNRTACGVLLTSLALAAAPRLAGQVSGCADTKFPADISSPSVLLDSTHAIEDLGAFADPAKPMVFSVFFATGDSVAQVRALDAKDAAAAVSLVNYVRHAPPRDLWAFRVRISGGDSPALTLERSLYCPPVSHELGSDHVTVVTGTVAVAGMPVLSPPEFARSSPLLIPVEALVATDGHVLRARVLQPSGNSELDADLVGEVRRLKFAPAKLDGQPIEALFRSGGVSPRP